MCTRFMSAQVTRGLQPAAQPGSHSTTTEMRVWVLLACTFTWSTAFAYPEFFDTISTLAPTNVSETSATLRLSVTNPNAAPTCVTGGCHASGRSVTYSSPNLIGSPTDTPPALVPAKAVNAPPTLMLIPLRLILPLAPRLNPKLAPDPQTPKLPQVSLPPSEPPPVDAVPMPIFRSPAAPGALIVNGPPAALTEFEATSVTLPVASCVSMKPRPTDPGEPGLALPAVMVRVGGSIRRSPPLPVLTLPRIAMSSRPLSSTKPPWPPSAPPDALISASARKFRVPSAMTRTLPPRSPLPGASSIS